MLVTRIKLKQTVRRQEYALLAAEALSCLAAMKGAAYPAARLGRVWRDLLFTMFHDAITATHVDASYEELRDVAAGIDRDTGGVTGRALKRLVRPGGRTVSVINPFGGRATEIVSATVPGRWAGVKVTDSAGRAAAVVACEKLPGGRLGVRFVAKDVPALSARTYKVAAAPAIALSKLRKPIISNQRFRVEADDNGIISIHDRRLGLAVARAGAYRPNEAILERDEGSPWATLSPHRDRVALGSRTHLVSAERTGAYERLTFRAGVSAWQDSLANCNQVRWISSVTLYRGIDRVDFSTDVEWHTFNYRLRVAFPVPRRGVGIYGIPYGMLRREPYEAQFEKWAAANGDWPAVNWAGVQAAGLSVAVLNRGLPSYRIDPARGTGSVILLSVLRSPAIPTYLHEPYCYVMTDYDGMRDEGSHHFEYALTAYDAPFAAGGVVNDAEAYNAGLLAVAGAAALPEAPRVKSDHVRLAAMKWAEKGRALIVRLLEFRGRGGTAQLAVPGNVRSVSKVNLLERAGEDLPLRSAAVRVPVRPWEIATLRMEL